MPNIVGDLAIHEAPDSPSWSFQDVTKCTRTFNGPYAQLLSSAPQKGSSMDDIGDNMVVISSALVRRAPNMAVLTVQLVGTTVDIPSSANQAYSETVEIDWIAVQKDLRTHPKFAEEGNLWPNPKPITLEGWAKIEQWRAETDIALKTATPRFKYKDKNDAVQELTDNETIAAKKILKATDSYNVYAPVIRKTSVFKNQPQSGSCGIVGPPDVDADIPDAGDGDVFLWLKTASRVIQQTDQNWQLIEEWTGADSIDLDLYKTATISAEISPK